MSTKTKKYPPLKKRHTKPCKYFQFGLCTNTAEECNFAHVSVMPSLTFPPSMQGLHGLGRGHASSYTGACSYVNPYPTQPPYYYHPWAPASLYPGHPGSFTVGSPEIPTNVQSPDVKSRSYSTSMSVASPQLDAPCVDFDSTVGALGLTRNEENEDEKDCVRTGNPNVRVEDRPLFDRPEGYAMRESPVWDSSGTPHQTSWDGAWGSRNQATRGPRRSIIRTVSRKTTKYKTKPCKFYTVENGCPNGDRCTFIHSTDVPPVPPMTLSHSQNTRPRRKSDSYLQAPCIATFKGSGEPDIERPRVDTSETEDNKEKKKDFFPITWRVIGGGVLIGGKRAENPGEKGLSTDRGEEVEEVSDDDKNDKVIEKELPKLCAKDLKRRSRSMSPSIP
ncbi:hypothetical protein AGABI2DRAFT_179291 [Agaricus bisporus var. bisporus H97]|uniref:hypothetical protein n=1 Tax=Agaricus bisporus var. bisporus (strain H97 / ATCC MYA-4626 / FGSC 10389) TaxID=936046 RepID=UPI00029F72E5|nr:hypothetical protein AGABI2DRAFT_179291 [Agaricus bisporus var. bisporus H97]EKV45779.1 hypothetical protein AGABI2DRAFT_179291 [Agaricus bisporus var. bisporus H97]